MSAGQAAPARPVKLEVNRHGLYRDVVTFDASDEIAEANVRQAVELLGMVDRKAAFRVVSCGAYGGPLLHYSAQHGWTPAG